MTVNESSQIEGLTRAERRPVRRAIEELVKPHPGARPGLKSRPIAGKRCGESATLRVYVYVDVLRELAKICRYRPERAVALLSGDYGFDERGLYVEVQGYRSMEYLREQSLGEAVGEGVEAWWGDGQSGGTPGGLPLGFVAISPGSEALLSAEMARIHLSYFNRPQQVVLVLDGVDDQVGLYGRRGGERFANQGFFVVDRTKREGPDAGEELELEQGDR